MSNQDGTQHRSVDVQSSEAASLEDVIQRAQSRLLDIQFADGHWAFPLEADVTIPAEYILLNHYLGEIDDELEAKLANYIRRIQGKDGGWPLYHDGDFNVSASVKAYFALKLVGDDPAEPHMVKARDAILAHGGAKESNVFTRLTLALFGMVPWRATPVTRIEVLLAPKWFPLHINKVSYWTRTVTVPLLILTALRPIAKNPRNVTLDELFTKSRFEEDYRIKNPTEHWIGNLMIVLDRLARPIEKFLPNYFVNRSIDKALSFIAQPRCASLDANQKKKGWSLDRFSPWLPQSCSLPGPPPPVILSKARS